MRKILVTGAGGFIGHHMVNKLKDDKENWVRGVDIKNPEFEATRADEFVLSDLREKDNCLEVCHGIDEVISLASDMGGIGFIENNKAIIVRNNVLINIHMLDAARVSEVKKYFFSSSACVYAGYRQKDANVVALKEEYAYPADAEDGYGWEKLYTERACRHYYEDFGLETRVARFHNIMGDRSTYDGGREKAPAALCRKVALTKDGDEIEIWGDGEQTRSFCYVDDCVEGVQRLMRSDFRDPINIGSEELVTINQMVDMICEIACKKLKKVHNLNAPLGVRGRNSDNTLLRKVLHWEPKITLREGLEILYYWVEEQLRKSGRIE